MNKKTTIVLLTTLLLAVALAQATHVEVTNTFSDNFNDGSINGTIWHTISGTPAEGSGYLECNDNEKIVINHPYAHTPVENRIINWTFTLNGANTGVGYNQNIWNLQNGSEQNDTADHGIMRCYGPQSALPTTCNAQIEGITRTTNLAVNNVYSFIHDGTDPSAMRWRVYVNGALTHDYPSNRSTTEAIYPAFGKASGMSSSKYVRIDDFIYTSTESYYLQETYFRGATSVNDTNITEACNVTTIAGIHYGVTNGSLINVTNGTNTITTACPGYANLTDTFVYDNTSITNYTADGVYQSLVTFNASIFGTSDYATDYTLNITGVGYDYSQNSGTAQNLNVGLMYGSYESSVDHVNYSTYQKDFSLVSGNDTTSIVMLLYTINSVHFTFLDEVTRDLITDAITVYLISSGGSTNHSTTNGSLSVGLLTPAAYTIRYSGNNYYERDYYQTIVADNAYDLNLYALGKNDSTTMTVTVRDTGGDPVEQAIVKLLRYYSYCNCYEIVEMAETSYSGLAYFNADAYDGHYKFIVEQGGTTYFQSTSPENFIPENNLITKTIVINLGTDYYESYQALTGLGTTVVWNNGTKTLSFTWNDPEGIVTQGCLYSERIDGVDWAAANSTCASGSTGSVNIYLPTAKIEKYRYWAEVHTNTKYSLYEVATGFIEVMREHDFRNLGMFLGGSVTIGLALLFSYSAIAVIIITVIGTFAMSVIGLAPFTTAFIIALGALGIGMATFLMRR